MQFYFWLATIGAYQEMRDLDRISPLKAQAITGLGQVVALAPQPLP